MSLRIREKHCCPPALGKANYTKSTPAAQECWLWVLRCAVRTQEKLSVNKPDELWRVKSSKYKGLGQKGGQVPWGHAEQKSRKDWTVRPRYLHSGSSSMLVKEDIQSSGHVELHSNGWWRLRVTQMSKDKIWVIGMVKAGDCRYSCQRLQVHDSKISFPSRPWMMSGAKAGAPEGSVKQDLTQEPQLQMH